MKLINFLGGAQPLHRPYPLAGYGASILASSALDLRPTNVPVALTPMPGPPPTGKGSFIEVNVRSIRTDVATTVKADEEMSGGGGGTTAERSSSESTPGLLRFNCHLCSFVVRALSPSALVDHLRQQHQQAAASLLTTPRVKPSF